MPLSSEMMPGSNTKHTIWRGHDPTTMLGSIFYYDRLKISPKTLLFINGSHDRVCRWCKNRFVKEWGIHGLRWYCSKQCRIEARRLMVRASKARIRIGHSNRVWEDNSQSTFACTENISIPVGNCYNASQSLIVPNVGR